MVTIKPTWQQFETIISHILQANNFDVSVHGPRGDDGFDFGAEFSAEIWAIEVKYYRTARVQPALILAAAARVAHCAAARRRVM